MIKSGDEMVPEQSHATWEKELDDQLIAQEKRKVFSWSFLNQPIVLWLFSTIAVGILTFTFTNYSSCKSELQSDREKLSKLLNEVGFRDRQIGFRFPQDLSKDGAIEQAKQVINPNLNFMFKDFKGVRTEELRWNILNIADKWDLAHETYSSDPKIPFTPIKQIEKSISAQIMVEILVRNFGKTTLPMIGRTEVGNLEQRLKDLRDAGGMAADYWKKGWTNPNLCVVRAVWPSYRAQVSELN
ncbi:hypothetical protein ACVWXM_007733 [Bradyrhizobium sp. GM7.3]